MDNWVKIYETDQLFQAEMVKNTLEENGIAAVILNQRDSSYNMFGSVNVMVNVNDREKAAEIITNL